MFADMFSLPSPKGDENEKPIQLPFPSETITAFFNLIVAADPSKPAIRYRSALALANLCKQYGALSRHSKATDRLCQQLSQQKLSRA